MKLASNLDVNGNDLVNGGLTLQMPNETGTKTIATKEDIQSKFGGSLKFIGSAIRIKSGTNPADTTIVVAGETQGSEVEIVAAEVNKGHIYQIGDKEYASNGSVWVEFGSDVDLTSYLTKTEAASTYATISDLIEDEEVIAAALTDLDERTTDIEEELENRQELTEGTNIDITNGVISAIGYTYDTTTESFAVGNDSVASGAGSYAGGHVESSGHITATGKGSFVYGDIESTGSIIAKGTGSCAEGFAYTGMIKAASTGSFARGEVYSNGRIYAYGHGSSAEGYVGGGDGHISTDGDGSHAEGIVYGNESLAAVGIGSHAEGRATKAISSYSHAEGHETSTYGESSHAEGYKTTTHGENSHAEGSGYYSSFSFSFSGAGAATQYTTSSAHNLIVGNVVKYGSLISIVTDIPSTTSFVVDNTLSPISAISSGTLQILHGVSYAENSHSEGIATIAGGDNSHAEGDNAVAFGEDSHAEGEETRAYGDSSHVEGSYTVAYNLAEHSEGNNNVSHETSGIFGNAGNTQHSIGIGTNTNNRKNAVEVMQNGDAYLYGVGGYDGVHIKNEDPNVTVKSLQDVLQGLETLPKKKNELIYSDDNQSFTSHELMYEGGGLIVDNPTDLASCKAGADTTMASVYNTWNAYGSSQSDKNMWGYCDSTASTAEQTVRLVGGTTQSVPVFKYNGRSQDYIFNTKNTDYLTGYYSQKGYTNYDSYIATGIISSLKQPSLTDYMGIVIGLYSADGVFSGISLSVNNEENTSSNSRESISGQHTISLIAWSQSGPDQSVGYTPVGTQILTSAEGLLISKYNSSLSNGYSTATASTILTHIQKQGNIFTIYASDPYPTTDDDFNHKDDIHTDCPIIINLNNTTLTYTYKDNSNNYHTVVKDFSNSSNPPSGYTSAQTTEIKTIFDNLKGSAKRGFEVHSNPGSIFRNCSQDERIIDVTPGEYKVYDFDGERWNWSFDTSDPLHMPEITVNSVQYTQQLDSTVTGDAKYKWVNGSSNIVYTEHPVPLVGETAYENSDKTGNTETISAVSGKRIAPLDELKNGSRIAWNRITDKLFYCNGTNVYRIASSNGGTTNTIPVGTIQMYAGAIEPEGWLICDGRMIGYQNPSSSNNYVLTNQNYESLVNLLKTTYSNDKVIGIITVSGGTLYIADGTIDIQNNRIDITGTTDQVSSAAWKDYTEFGSITTGVYNGDTYNITWLRISCVPNFQNRFPLGSYVHEGMASNLGAIGGSAYEFLTAEQCGLPRHTHAILVNTDGTSGQTSMHPVNQTTNAETNYSLDTDNSYNSPVIQSAGGYDATVPHNNMPPFVVVNYIIKY